MFHLSSVFFSQFFKHTTPPRENEGFAYEILAPLTECLSVSLSHTQKHKSAFLPKVQYEDDS